ncbi:hypothetical protein V6N13_110754 [Hibiscus sabdariffa]
MGSGEAKIFDVMLYQSDGAQEDEAIASTDLDDLSNCLPEPLKDEVMVMVSTDFDEPIEDIFDSRATPRDNVGSVNSNQPVQFLSFTQLGKLLGKREQDLLLSVSGASQMFEEMLARINGALSIVIGYVHSRAIRFSLALPLLHLSLPFRALDLNENSVNETINSLTNLQDARIQVAYEKLFPDTDIERCIHMDLGIKVDFDKIKKMSTEYAVAKRKAIEEVGEVVDVQNIKQIREYEKPLSEAVEKIDDKWNNQREVFYQRTGLSHRKPAEEQLQLQLIENEVENNDGDEFYRLLYEHD